jgi:hypothetical protein
MMNEGAETAVQLEELGKTVQDMVIKKLNYNAIFIEL